MRWLCFDDHGVPAALDAPVPGGVAASAATAGDLDGDGTVEAIAAVGG